MMIEVEILYPVIQGQTQAATLYIRNLVIKGSLLTRATSLRVIRRNAVSRARYRPKALLLRNTWIRTVADMETRADALLEVLAKPEKRVKLNWYVTDWDTFRAIEISDRVRVSLPSFASDGFVEGISASIPIAQNLNVCTLDVSLTDTVAPAGALAGASFADDTGDDQTWTQNDAITSITVPAATGNPTPTYAAVGSLPAGISFNTTTRVISGTPTATGSGTITIRATNSEGSDDWTVDYTTGATATVPSRPAAPSLVVDSDTQITATGVAPSNGGSPITSYDWRHRVTGSGGSGWVNRSNVTNLSSGFLWT